MPIMIPCGAEIKALVAFDGGRLEAGSEGVDRITLETVSVGHLDEQTAFIVWRDGSIQSILDPGYIAAYELADTSQIEHLEFGGI